MVCEDPRQCSDYGNRAQQHVPNTVHRQLKLEYQYMTQQLATRRRVVLGHAKLSVWLNSQSVTSSLDPVTLTRLDFFSSW